MICKCRRSQSFSGKSAFKSRSVRATLLPSDKPQRAASRWMCVSTGNAASPNAWDITTLAVLCPTPGRASRSSNVRGTRPPWRSTRSSDSPWSAFDFAGDSPQGLITSRMAGAPSFAISAGVLARANSFGVVKLTRLSVHCAESRTATSSVYGSRWSSGTAGRGYRRSRTAWMRAAFSCLFMPGGGYQEERTLPPAVNASQTGGMDAAAKIKDFLAAGPYAVVGTSRRREKYGNKVLRTYLQRGLQVFPVHPRETTIEGVATVPDIASLPDGVRGLSIITPPAVTEKLVGVAAAKGIRRLWMQPGAESRVAIEQAESLGLSVIAGGPCLLVALGFRE